MKRLLRNLCLPFTLLILTATSLHAQTASTVATANQSPEMGAHLGAQAAADVLRDFARTDAAFLAGGLVKENFQRDNLATLLQFPTEEIVVVSLTGAQIRQALERSVSYLPQPNGSFLQLSGLEATFSRTAAANSRISNVTIGGARLEDGRTYTVAMPSSLGRGGLGYFKIWDKAKITKTFEGTTIEDVLKGKRYSESSPRWSSAS